jgi:hypothetical protein
MAEIKLNPGAQTAFVLDQHRASAFIGGLGAGKTFALLAKGFLLSQQPKKGFYGPRGCVAAINYPVLKDVVLPLFFELAEKSGLLLEYIKSEKKALLIPFDESGKPNKRLVGKQGLGAAEILFRSLDQPNWMRGLELSWFGIDEGRHVDGSAWDILYGRLRQKGYAHRGFVASTPNGYDWMWSKFHPDSPHRIKDSAWYNAATFDNRANLPPEYIDSLVATYKGRFLRQEVYGEFVGAIEGSVYFEWDPSKHVRKDLKYRADLPLYSFWDFGMGDLGVVVFAQVEWKPERPEGATRDVMVPYIYILDALEAKDRTSQDWVYEFKRFISLKYNLTPEQMAGNICDPAGEQRNISTGKSIIEDLYQHGLKVSPAPRRHIDYGVRLINNLLAADRILVSSDAERVIMAFSSYHWPTDSSGFRTGSQPVHDWSSHFMDAVRYGITSLVGFRPRPAPVLPNRKYSPNQWGFIEQQLLKNDDPDPWGLSGETEEEIMWEPGIIRI